MSKYNSKKTIIDGISFDSRKEAKRYQELKLLEKSGEISDLRLQVEYVLIPSQYEDTGETYKKGINKGKPKTKLVERSVSYFADFVYKENGQTVVEDTKGVRTKEYIIKRKLMLLMHGIRIREI